MKPTTKSISKATPICVCTSYIHTYIKQQYIYGSERLINICMNVFFLNHYYCLDNCLEYEQIFISTKREKALAFLSFNWKRNWNSRKTTRLRRRWRKIFTRVAVYFNCFWTFIALLLSKSANYKSRRAASNNKSQRPNEKIQRNKNVCASAKC